MAPLRQWVQQAQGSLSQKCQSLTQAPWPGHVPDQGSLACEKKVFTNDPNGRERGGGSEV